MGMTRIVAALAAIGVASLVAAEAQAQPYPNKPIKIVVPLTAGSPVDVVGRLVGNHLSAALRQPVIVENRPGAGATIGAKAVASPIPTATRCCTRRPITSLRRRRSRTSPTIRSRILRRSAPPPRVPMWWW